MRRLSAAIGTLLLAGGLAAVAGITPAHAACPAGDGSLPNSGSKVTRVGTGGATQYTTIYIDDRDVLDLDEDNNTGGLWLYIESNSTAGLQRGGDQVAFTFVNPNVPRVNPITVVPAGGGVGLPAPAKDVVLFPNGFGGGSLSEAIGLHDDCKTDEGGNVWTGKADSILF